MSEYDSLLMSSVRIILTARAGLDDIGPGVLFCLNLDDPSSLSLGAISPVGIHAVSCAWPPHRLHSAIAVGWIDRDHPKW